MSELLKIGTKRADGTAQPLMTDMHGNLRVKPDKLYVPTNTFDTHERLVEERRLIKSRFIESKYNVIGNSGDLTTGWVKNTSADHTIVTDSTIYDDGDASLKFNNQSGSSYTPTLRFKGTAESPDPIDLSGFEALHLWVHTDTLDEISGLSITFESQSTTDFYRFNLLNMVKTVYGDGEIVLHKADFSSNGNPNWNQINRFYVSLTNRTSGTNAQINFANVYLIKAKPHNAKLMFRIDDGLRSVYDVAMPVFRKYKVPATIYVPPEYVKKGTHGKSNAYDGTLDAMSYEELEELRYMGWAICSHGFGHLPYYDPSASGSNYLYDRRRHYSQAYSDLYGAQKWYEENFPDMAFGGAFPNRWHNKDVMDAAQDICLIDFSGKIVHTSYDFLPWGKSVTCMKMPEALTTEEIGGVTHYTAIDTLLERGGLMSPVFHRFDGDSEQDSISAETLEAFIQYAVAQDGIDFITAADLAYTTPVALR